MTDLLTDNVAKDTEYNDFTCHEFSQFLSVANNLRDKHNLSTYDLIDLLLDDKKKKAALSSPSIPIEVFNNNSLSSLETVVKFLKENAGMKPKRIAELLNRNVNTISTTYRNSKQKMHENFMLRSNDFSVPCLVFSDRELSMLESLVSYLKNERNLTNNKIAKLINRNDRTVWTVYNRFKKKRG